MLPSELLDFQYYYNKLPLYLQQSEGFKEHFRYWIELLNGIDSIGDKYKEMSNIFDSDYLTKYPYCSDFLNKLGLLYGVSRVMKIDGTDVTLSDKMLLLLIRLQVVKNYFNGTNEQLTDFYKNIAKLPIMYLTYGHMFVKICFAYDQLETPAFDNYTSTEVSQIRWLLSQGYLYICSLGVLYDYEEVSLADIGFWDNTTWNSTKKWGL